MFGIDYLAGARYPELILSHHPKGWAAGFFHRTFGDAFDTVKRLANSGDCPLIRVHLTWSDTHTYGAPDMHQVLQASRRYEALAKQIPQVKFEISPFCEHNLTKPEPFLDDVAGDAPSCTIVNTPWLGRFVPGRKNEVHGRSPRPGIRACNFSFDGTDAFSNDARGIIQQHRDSEVIFLWCYAMNLVRGKNDHTPRPQRTYRPDATTLSRLVALAH